MTTRDSRSVSPRNLPRHPVISWGEAARRLGVTKAHLWLVMNGKRRSARISAAYAALLRQLSQQ